MAKVVRMTPEMIEGLRHKNLVNGKIPVTDINKKVEQNAIIWYTPDAYVKQTALIMSTNNEVAWHGIAHRVDGKLGEYLISDILVYPQVVSEATVNTDQAEYNDWIMGLDDDTFNGLKMQAHSHVNMATTPSGTDEEHQAKIVEQLEGDMFYIFMIWNKSFKFTARIYDLAINTMFEPSEVSIQMIDTAQGLNEFIADAMKMVKTRQYSTNSTTYAYSAKNPSDSVTKPAAQSTKPVTTAPSNAAKTSKSDIPSRPKTYIGCGWKGSQYYGNQYDYYDDDDLMNMYR